ncbi:MAG: FAD-dependent oxidoreductase [Opitutia bacterium AMD-G1]|nr:MAG: FAD-dependent oxidoreductase [Opitutae bacterium AMD-G1]
MLLRLSLLCLLSLRLVAAETYDVVIYGGTSAGVIAAVQAKKLGKSVVIVGPDVHLGGLSSGGLGYTDTGNKAVIGGLARNFYHRVWVEYQKPETWKWQKTEAFGNKGQGTVAMDKDERTMWIFEPSVAEKVFEDYVKEFGLRVLRDEWLDRAKGVRVVEGRIAEITMLSGKSFKGKMFIDATYEGDLLAAAGVSFHVGREANATYGEEWNGNQVGILHHGHHFGAVKKPVSAYKIPGDPASGLLPRISTDAPGVRGEGDKRVQAYCYRWCATDHPDNRIPFPKPPGYDASQYELLVRVLDAGWRQTFHKFDLLPNRKTDTNNHGPFSFDNIGMNYDYPEASYERRREILAEHRTYQQGLLWFLANDPRVPADVREEANRWGLPKDEFKDNGHWPHQIYVREARRMVGAFVMTENELTKKQPTPDSVGMGSYTIDSHNVRRYVTPEGHVQNEGDIGVPISPYSIAYGSLVPKRGEIANLFAPVACSASHIDYGSIRMEPVFMILAQSAATAAALAIEGNLAVQDVPYAALRARLLADGQVLEHESSKLKPKGHGSAKPAAALPGVTVDDDEATLSGEWKQSSANGGFVGSGYRHDDKGAKGALSATFATKLPKAGKHEVFLTIVPNANRATNAKVSILHAGGQTERVVNLSKGPENRLVSLGIYDFSDRTDARVIVSNEGADGYVLIDAVNWQAR